MMNLFSVYEDRDDFITPNREYQLDESLNVSGQNTDENVELKTVRQKLNKIKINSDRTSVAK